MESASAHRARSRADRLVSFSRAHRARLEFPRAARRSLRAARALIPATSSQMPHAQKLETPEYIQVEQRVRVVHAAVAARPPRLLPAIKAANHHLRRMDQVVMQILNLTRSESPGPMRFFQLASETFLAGGGRSACKEAILEMAGQKRVVLQVPDRLSLGVQNGLYALDDIFAMRQKQSQQLNVPMNPHPFEREYNEGLSGMGRGSGSQIRCRSGVSGTHKIQ